MLKSSLNIKLLIFFLTLILNYKLLAKENISFTFHNIKIRSALQYLSEMHNNNLIIDDKIQGEFSIYLHDINWEQALDTILQTQGLAKRSIINGWFITTSDQLLKQDRINLQIQQKKKNYLR